MRRLVIFACLVVFINQFGMAQDTRTDKQLLASAYLAVAVTEESNSNFLLHTEDVIVKFPEKDFGLYFFVNELSRVKKIQPSTKPGDFVDIDVYRTENLDVYDGSLQTEMASLGAGVSLGSDSLRWYIGLGYSLNRKGRFNYGLYYRPNATWSFSGLLDMASGDWRYDGKVVYYGRQPDSSWPLGIGAYAKSRLGIGFLGQMDLYQIAVVHVGAGFDPEAKVDNKMRLWAGLSLAI